MQKIFSIILLTTVSCGVFAQTAVPHTFTAGTAAKASEVNANFQSLATSIDALVSRLDILEGKPSAFTVSALSGTYKLLNIYSGAEGGSSPIVHSSTQNGTLNLNSDLTFTLTAAEINSNTTLNLSTNTSSSSVTTNNDTINGTWSVSGKTITLTAAGGGVFGPYEIGAGNKLLINPVRSDSSPAYLGIDIFVRQ